jgi:SOS-response transcriptional repressor LexA
MENRWPESTYKAHENGTRTIGQDDAEKYASRFHALGATATAKSILFGPEAARAATPKEPGIVRIPLLSWVSAGRFADATSQLPSEDVPMMAFADLGPGDYFALKVVGDSMDRISPEGSVIVVNRADRTLVADRFYVFSVRGETTYKRWHPGDPQYLAPFSTNAHHDPIFVNQRKFGVVGRVRRTVLDL